MAVPHRYQAKKYIIPQNKKYIFLEHTTTSVWLLKYLKKTRSTPALKLGLTDKRFTLNDINKLCTHLLLKRMSFLEVPVEFYVKINMKIMKIHSSINGQDY
ncbi:hypothetical protein COF73_11910 [Bacillus toyonensis]|nr:hypothetical protein COF73_11910 [Bacillus toyonensis]